MTRQSFISTKEHRRFAEFVDGVCRQHTIGICYCQAARQAFRMPRFDPVIRAVRPVRSKGDGWSMGFRRGKTISH